MHALRKTPVDRQTRSANTKHKNEQKMRRVSLMIPNGVLLFFSVFA
jgi:hypothetical protein